MIAFTTVDGLNPFKNDLIAIQPIQKDEELFFSYLSPDELKLSKQERQKIIFDGWGFNCHCKRCQEDSMLHS